MEIKRVQRLAAKWAAGYVCTLRDGEATRYHQTVFGLCEKVTPKSPYPDGDKGILACPCCGSGEWLHNADENPMNFCGQCGQAIDWSEDD